MLGEMLILASSAGDIEAMQGALEAGADVNLRVRLDNDSTVLDYAAYEVFSKRLSIASLRRVVTCLLESGFNPNLKNADGTAALANVIDHDSDGAMTKLLIEHDADPDITDTSGWTPLMIAAQSGRLRVVEHLLTAGCALDAKTVDGKTALGLATQAGKGPVVRLLKSRGARR